MAARYYNKTNVNGASERNVIPAMVLSKVKVHKTLLTQARDVWEIVFYFDVILSFS